MVRRDAGSAVTLEALTMHRGDALGETEDGAAGRVTHREQDPVSGLGELGLEPGGAGRDFLVAWRTIGRRAALHHVGDETVGPGETSLFFEEAKQQATTRTDEGFTALVLGLLAALSLVGGGASPAQAARDTNSYDGNIYALYAGNGSLVPPRSTLAQAMADHRPIVLGFFLDDSAASKQYAVVFNELQRLWGRTAELILLPTDPLQNRKGDGPTDPASYWKGVIPQVVVFNTAGKPVLDETGPVSIDAINAALTEVTGLKPQGDVKLSLNREVNELNSEIVPAR